MIRPATPEDAPGLLAIYAPLVRTSHVSFELEPPAEDDLRARIVDAPEGSPWLVWEEGGEILGYAYAARFRDRPAYRWTAEASMYVRPDGRRRGIGRALGEALIAELRRSGARSVVGVVALPNDASAALLAGLGFRRVGVLESAGWKLGAWWDVALWQRTLAAGMEAPPG